MANIPGQWKQRAYERGVDAAKSAASWALDGNTPAESYKRTLRMLEDGDPAVEDRLPRRPDLSGEWAGAPTPHSIVDEVLGAGDWPEHLVDEVADEWERGVSETFESECERLLREAVSS